MPPKDFSIPGRTAAESQYQLQQILVKEKNLGLSDEIANSQLKTKIKRADASKFALVKPKGEIDITAGVRQNRGGAAPANKFHNSGQNGSNKAAQNGGNDGLAYGTDEQAKKYGAQNAYDDETGAAVAWQSPAYGNAYDDEPIRTGSAPSNQQSLLNQTANKPAPAAGSAKQEMTYQSVVAFAHNTRSAYGDSRDADELPNKKEVYRFNHQRSAMNRIAFKHGMEKKGFSVDSPLARANEKTNLPRDMGRWFFRYKMRENKYRSPDYMKEFNDLSIEERASITKSELMDKFGMMSNPERRATALDAARLKASDLTIKKRSKDRKSVEIQKSDPKDPNRMGMREQIATAIDDSERNRDMFRVLDDDAIKKGAKEIDFWAKQLGKKEINKLKEDYFAWCNEYNEHVKAQLPVREARRVAMAKSPLQELGMPVAMPRELNLDEVFSEATNEYIESRGFHRGKSLLAGFLNVITLSIAGRYSKWVRHHLDNMMSNKSLTKLENELSAHMDKRTLEHFREENRLRTKEWVLEQYKYDPDNIKQTAHDRLFDPMGFYAAFANFSKPEILQNIKDQLTRAAGFDPDNLPKDSKEYQEFEHFLDPIANGVFDGMCEALDESAHGQAELRRIAVATADADSYVNVTNAEVRFSCERSWDQVDNIFDSYNNTSSRDHYVSEIETNLLRVQARESELDESEKDGVIKIDVGRGDKEEIGEINLPVKGDRRKLLRQNVDAAKSDIAAAVETGTKLNEIFGSRFEADSMLGVQDALDEDLAELAYDTAPRGTDDEIKQKYDALRAKVDDLRVKADQTKGLNETQAIKLEMMLDDLEDNINAQQKLRERVIQAEKSILEPTSAGDLDKRMQASFEADVVGVEMQLSRTEDGIGEDPKVVHQTLKALRNEITSWIKSTRDTLEALDGAQKRMGQLEQQVRDGAISLRQASQSAMGAYNAFAGNHAAHLKGTARRPQFAAKFDESQAQLQERMARLLPASLGIEVSDDDRLSKDAVAAFMHLYKAGAIDQVFVDALKETVTAKAKNNKPTIKDLNETLESMIASDNSAQSIEREVRSFSTLLFHNNPDAKIAFDVKVLRQFGADETRLRTLQHKHFVRQARSAVVQSQEAVLKASSILIGDDAPKSVEERKADMNKAGIHVYDEDDMDVMDIQSDIEEDDDDGIISDEDDGAPQMSANDIIDEVVKMAPKHPLFQSMGQEWVTNAAQNLKDLLNDKKAGTLTSDEMARARNFAQMFKSISGDKDELQDIRKSIHQGQADMIRSQIGAQLGFDPKNVGDATLMKNVANQAIVDKRNATGMQDITRRSDNVLELMRVQQEEAEQIKGAVIDPLLEFGELLNDDKDIQTADQVQGLMESKKFKSKAKVLEDLCRLDDAMDVVDDQQDVRNSPTYKMNLMAVKRLAPELRGFDPNKMQSGNRYINKLAMWWKEENAVDVSENVLAGGGRKMAKKFEAVWSHLKMLSAIGASNELLVEDLKNLQNERDALLDKVQLHRQDQIVTLAIMEEFKNSGGTLDEFTLNDDAISNIKSRLGSWGQAMAWDGFLKRNNDVKPGGKLTNAMMEKWQADSTGLPTELQKEYDRLNKALTDFEAMIEATAGDNAQLLGTPADPSVAKQYDAEQVQSALDAQPQQTAWLTFGSVLDRNADWHQHKDWNGASVKNMQEMKPEEFTNELKNGLQNFVDNAGKTSSSKKQNATHNQRDRQWIEGLVKVLNKLERYNTLVEKTLDNKAAMIQPSNDTMKELKILQKELKNDAEDLSLNMHNELKGHRFESGGSGRYRYRKPTDHFLNAVDKSLARNIPYIVDRQMARLADK